MDYNILKSGLSICRLPAEAPFPSASGEFFCITRTSRELSVVCETAPPDLLEVEPGWTALEIAGPLDFALTGILASFAKPLAESGISLFAISTFNTDYILVKTPQLKDAVRSLAEAGHRLLDTVPK